MGGFHFPFVVDRRDDDTYTSVFTWQIRFIYLRDFLMFISMMQQPRPIQTQRERCGSTIAFEKSKQISFDDIHWFCREIE